MQIQNLGWNQFWAFLKTNLSFELSYLKKTRPSFPPYNCIKYESMLELKARKMSYWIREFLLPAWGQKVNNRAMTSRTVVFKTVPGLVIPSLEKQKIPVFMLSDTNIVIPGGGQLQEGRSKPSHQIVLTLKYQTSRKLSVWSDPSWWMTRSSQSWLNQNKSFMDARAHHESKER